MWGKLVDEARSGELPRAAAPIAASDRDAGAIDASRANAARAGVESDVAFTVAPISALGPAARERLAHPIRPTACASANAIVSKISMPSSATSPARNSRDGRSDFLADRRLESQTGLELRETFATRNGGIPVRMVVGTPSPRASRADAVPGGVAGFLQIVAMHDSLNRVGRDVAAHRRHPPGRRH